MKKCRGISLVILIITIIVIAILAGAVILIITSNNAITKSKESVRINNLKAVQEKLLLYRSNSLLDNTGNLWPVEESGLITKEYAGEFYTKLKVENDKLIYISSDRSDDDSATKAGMNTTYTAVYNGEAGVSNIPVNNFNINEGTIEAWVNVTENMRNEIAEKYIYSIYTDEKYTNTIALRRTRENKWEAIISKDYKQITSVLVNDDISIGWHLFTVKWNSGEFALFIDGTKKAYKENPTLLTGIPETFNIGIGPKLNIIENGYITNSNSNFTSTTYTTDDPYSQPGSIFKTGNAEFLSSQYIEVDTNKTYNIKGIFKSIGVGGNSLLYYGLDCCDADKLFIDPKMSYHYPETETTLAHDLKSGDQIVYLTNANGWKNENEVAYRRHIAIYNYKQYEPYTYTRYVYDYDSVDLAQNTIKLSSVYTGNTVKAGTKVADSYSASGYSYIAAGYSSVPSAWTTYTGDITGLSVSDNAHKFRFGTKYVRIMGLLNYAQTIDYSIKIDDMELKDTTQPIFNSKIDGVVISNIARTDDDILNRYNQKTLPSDLNTIYK